MYRAEQLPIFQNRTFGSAKEANDCLKGDVLIAQDSATGLISNQAFRPELLQYGADYHNEQGLSAVFQAHLLDVTRIIVRHFQGASLIEVGCGKGHFLESLQALGFGIVGVDPAYEGSNPAITKQYFSSQAGLSGDGIILRHVLEHIQDPIAFLSKIRDANGGRGKVYIEVPCFDWICEHRVWFDIFYEHVNYFRLRDFYRMFGTVYDAGHIFNGQYLYAVADLASLRTPATADADLFDFPGDFLESVNRYASRLNKSKSACRAIWGAASKGVIFALFMERAGARIDMAVDINPAKQGRFLAVTGLQVHAPDAAMEIFPQETEVFVMNGNYLEEIKALTKGRFDYIAVDNERI